MNEKLDLTEMHVNTLTNTTNEIQEFITMRSKKRNLKSVSFSSDIQMDNDNEKQIYTEQQPVELDKQIYMNQETVKIYTDKQPLELYTDQQPVEPEKEMCMDEQPVVEHEPIETILTTPPGGYLNFLNEYGSYDETTASTPNNATPKKARKAQAENRAIKFLKAELSKKYTEDELAKGSVNGGTRKFKNNLICKTALSPNRLQVIYTRARRQYKDEFELIENINEVINSKCRKVQVKQKRQNVHFSHENS